MILLLYNSSVLNSDKLYSAPLLNRTSMLFFGALAAAALAVDVTMAKDAATLSHPYDGLKVLRVPTGNASSVKQLDELISHRGYERWTTNSRENSYIDVQVPSADVDDFIGAAGAANSEQNLRSSVKTLHEDLGESIRAEVDGMFNTTATNAGRI
jgi:hypothetical protein